MIGADLVSDDNKRLAAYYDWCTFKSPVYGYGDLDHWLAGEHKAVWDAIYQEERVAFWQLVEDVRKEKEQLAYIGPLTVGGRPPVYSNDTDDRFKLIQQKIRSKYGAL